jgi:hypothetical protein
MRWAERSGEWQPVYAATELGRAWSVAVQAARDEGIDVDQVKLLRVGHEKFGHRWLILDHDQIRTRTEAFVAYLNDKMPAVVNMAEKARTVVLQTTPRFANDSMFIQLSDDQDGEERAIQLLYDAAAFLLTFGIVNVDQDTTETNFGWPDSENEWVTLH